MNMRTEITPQCPACGVSLSPDTGHTAQIDWWLEPANILPPNVDHESFGLEPEVFEGFLRGFRIDTEDKVRTLVRAYGVVQHHVAPFVMKVVVDMIPDLVAAVDKDPTTKIVANGRDGHAFGFVLAELMPNLFARHGASMYLPRQLVDIALQDAETHEGRDFSHIEVFRKRPTVPVDPTDMLRQLTAYFEQYGVDVDAGGQDIHLIDICFRGSIQEKLAALFPKTAFWGHLALYEAVPEDPHPGTKKGYALHLDVTSNHERGPLKGPLPEDLELTFLHQDAYVAIESLISGSKSSPTRFGANGRPDARRHRHDQRPLRGINPALVAPEYADPLVREAVLSISVIAIIHYARDLVPIITAAGARWYESAPDTPWYAELAQHGHALRDQLRAWITRSDTVDPEFACLLDAFAVRINKYVVENIDERLRRANLIDAERHKIWQEITKLYRS
ncbi:hypothetical protein [Nocardia sp. CC227C]|uniref:hypothetical protein n=1 Tax=Nocardia sp. CC227C TaxID=3044562 RepID=UPI00278BDB62|nr:hypothetical protein [Nocardia sp. CC227C]